MCFAITLFVVLFYKSIKINIQLIMLGQLIMLIILRTLILWLNISPITMSMGPSLHHNDSTTCEEFGKYARFNAHSILDDWWMSFYYWGPVQPTLHFRFRLPTQKEVSYLKYVFEGHVLEPINWNATLVLLQERSNLTHLLVEHGDRGEYLSYTPFKDFGPSDIAEATEIRLKQVNKGRYIGLMVCSTGTVYALTRYKDLPKKKDIQDEAAKFGFKGRGGKSYLYQGHEWMPIPEADDEDIIWERPRQRHMD